MKTTLIVPEGFWGEVQVRLTSDTTLAGAGRLLKAITLAIEKMEKAGVSDSIIWELRFLHEMYSGLKTSAERLLEGISFEETSLDPPSSCLHLRGVLTNKKNDSGQYLDVRIVECVNCGAQLSTIIEAKPGSRP